MIKLLPLVEQFFNESRVSLLKQQFVPKILSSEEFDQIANISVSKPTYIEWLLNVCKKEFLGKDKNFNDFMETKDEIVSKIEFFEKNKSLFDKKDITAYSLSDLNQAIDNINDNTGPAHSLSTIELEKLRKVGIKNLGIINGYQVLVIPKGTNSNQTFNVYRSLICQGRTHVCTASNYGRFEYYTTNDNLFIIIKQDDPLSPYHVAMFNKSYVDKNDKHIEDPQVWEVISKLEGKYS